MILTIFIVLSLAQAETLTGHVTAADGQPVAAATVVTQKFNQLGGYGEVKAETKVDGSFSIRTGGKVLFVRKQGFVPLSIKLDPAKTHLQIVLEPVSEARTFRVPTCEEQYGLKDQAIANRALWPKGIEFYGMGHHYPVPDRAHVENHSDADSGVHLITLPERKKEELHIRWGLPWGGYYPPIEFFENAAQFSERALSTGEPAEEIRGTLTNGHKFRWVGESSGDAFYCDVTPETAALFDNIIDQGCFSNWL